LLGYGDNLITLSLLEKASAGKNNLQVVGTGITKAVAELMRSPPSLAYELFDDLAAFYAIKQRGIAAAARDLLLFRRWSREVLSAADCLILESRDPRNHFLVPVRGCSVIQIPRTKGAYADREEALRPYVGEVRWPRCASPKKRAAQLLVNPSARHVSRILPEHVIDLTLRVAEDVGTEVVLLDVDGRFGLFQSRVSKYLLRPPLGDALHVLEQADCYVGPDSFFMHLAYYLRLPFLAFFSPQNVYFAPPGTLESGNCIYNPFSPDLGSYELKLRNLLTAGGDTLSLA
jgi:hypothetical protein